MFRKIIASILVISMLVTMSVTAFADYSDLSGHWAEDNILELVDLGYLTGYTDGTMLPDKEITTVEALSLLSRFYNPDDDVVEEINEDYGTFVAKYIEPSLEWAYDEIELCLAAGIVSEAELQKLGMTASIEKEMLCIFFVRALQMTDEAKATEVDLSFDDNDDITASYQPYVTLLVNNAIITGDQNNEFSPHLPVTRAVVATILVRCLDLLEDNGILLYVPDYENSYTVGGVISAADSSSITFRDHSGLVTKYTYDSSVSTTESGNSVVLSSTFVGGHCTLVFANETLTAIQVSRLSGDGEWVQGTMTSISTSGSGYSMYVKDVDSNNATRYYTIADCPAFEDELEISYSSLTSGSFVTLAVEDGYVTTVYANNGYLTVEGEITTLSISTTVTLVITNDDGVQYSFPMSISSLPTITKGNVDTSIDLVRVGDEATIDVEFAEAVAINISGDLEELEGTLSASTTTSSGTSWVIYDEYGDEYDLYISDSTAAYQNGSSIELSSIAVGSSVSVQYAGSDILSVDLISGQISSSNKVQGTVVALDSSAKTCTVLTTEGKLVYVSASGVGSILKVSTGRTTTFGSIAENTLVIVYGSYTSSSQFTADSMVIESD